jgi:hypothetical protein
VSIVTTRAPRRKRPAKGRAWRVKELEPDARVAEFFARMIRPRQ